MGRQRDRHREGGANQPRQISAGSARHGTGSLFLLVASGLFQKESAFFFEKKNQKLLSAYGRARLPVSEAELTGREAWTRTTHDRAEDRKEVFFFEKKNQKTFIRGFAQFCAAQRGQSLFASFSSEKEESSPYRSDLKQGQGRRPWPFLP